MAKRHSTCSFAKKKLKSINKRLDQLEERRDYAKTLKAKQSANIAFNRLSRKSIKVYEKIRKCDPSFQ